MQARLAGEEDGAGPRFRPASSEGILVRAVRRPSTAVRASPRSRRLIVLKCGWRPDHPSPCLRQPGLAIGPIGKTARRDAAGIVAALGRLALNTYVRNAAEVKGYSLLARGGLSCRPPRFRIVSGVTWSWSANCRRVRPRSILRFFNHSPGVFGLAGYPFGGGFRPLKMTWQKGNAGVSVRTPRRPRRPCGCTPLEIRRYLAKLSGPLIDRFDIVVEVPPVELAAPSSRGAGEPSSVVRAGRSRPATGSGSDSARAARPAARGRGRATSTGSRRSRPRRAACLDACERIGLSARGFGSAACGPRGSRGSIGPHVAEAVQYRRALVLGAG